jgi:digeranylgeranylglycerophospholipid reductase
MRQISCDIVVVGAGPAGSLAAKAAADNDVEVILVEEHREVGSPVYCAEGLSLNGLKDAGVEPEPGIVSQEIGKALVIAPNGDYVELTSDNWVGYVMNRTVFDKILADKAVQSGAQLMLRTRSKGVVREKGQVVGVLGERNGEEFLIHSKVTIGADGHASITRRSAGFTRWFTDVVTCAQYTLTGIDFEDPTINEFYVGEKYAPGGYAWVFPKSEETANVGLGVRKKHKMPPIEYLKIFVDNDPRFKDAEITRVGGGVCPVSGTLDQIVDDGFMLVGDAAGQLIPCTGAGIHSAIEAGKIAGRIAAEAVMERDVSSKRLSQYRREFDVYWGKRILDSRKVVELLDKFTDEDLNLLADVITNQDILDLANGNDVSKTLTQIIKRSPMKIMRLIKAFLR